MNDITPNKVLDLNGYAVEVIKDIIEEVKKSSPVEPEFIYGYVENKAQGGYRWQDDDYSEYTLADYLNVLENY